MATLDDVDVRQFPPLDINTPMTDRFMRPTERTVANNRSMVKRLVAAFGNHQAVLTEQIELTANEFETIALAIATLTATDATNLATVESYQQAVIDAMSAGAMRIDSVSAEFDDIEQAIQVSMQAISAPSGITNRYEIKLTANGENSTGLIFDLVDEGGGSYSGNCHINANKVTIGNTTTVKDLPFRIVDGVVYIKEAVIKELSIGTERVKNNAIISTVVTSTAASPKGPGDTARTASIYCETGNVTVEFSAFLERPTENSFNYGTLEVRIKRDGSVIKAFPMFWDDNFAFPFYCLYEDGDAVTGETNDYEVVLVNTVSNGMIEWEFTGCVMRLANVKK